MIVVAAFDAPAVVAGLGNVAVMGTELWEVVRRAQSGRNAPTGRTNAKKKAERGLSPIGPDLRRSDRPLT
jgi:hypothetical protein